METTRLSSMPRILMRVAPWRRRSLAKAMSASSLKMSLSSTGTLRSSCTRSTLLTVAGIASTSVLLRVAVTTTSLRAGLFGAVCAHTIAPPHAKPTTTDSLDKENCPIRTCSMHATL